jgi:DNA-binding transcriptional ArsR family regulator
MGTTKTDFFDEKQNRLANFAKAIGHPARIAILEHLLNEGKSTCGEIVKQLPLAQPTISQHLKELKSAGLLKSDTNGNSVSYSINDKSFAKFEKQVKPLLKQARKAKD